MPERHPDGRLNTGKNYQRKSDFTKSEKKKLLSKKWRLNHLYKIKDREDKIIQFKQNPAQTHYFNHKHTRNIILKSRRLGFSTEIDIELLDSILFSNADALIVAHKEEDMKKLFKEKVKRAWNHFPFPHWLDVITNNKTMMEFHRGVDKEGNENKSSISVSLSGRSGGYNKMHISEFGKICAKFPQKAKEIISGSIPAVPENGEVVIESTAEGRGGYFYDYFWRAWERQKENNPEDPHDTTNLDLRNKQWKAFFYSWRWDKEEIEKTTKNRDPIPLSEMSNQEFFSEQQFKHGLTPQELTYYYLQYETLGEDMELLLREYPTTPEEAFDAGEESWFNSTSVKQQQQYTKDYEVENSWKVFEEPNATHTYAIGVDPSSGEGGDHTAAAVWDFTTIKPTLVATFQSNKIKPDVMAHKLKQAGIRYNNALIAVEQGRWGFAMLTTLKNMYPTPKIFKEVDQRKKEDRQTDKLGWPTNKATKPKMFSEFSTAIDEDIIKISDERVIDEALSYPQDEVTRTRNKKDDGQTRHWDLLTATVIGFQMKDYVSHNQQATTIRLKQDNQQESDSPTSGKHAAI